MAIMLIGITYCTWRHRTAIEQCLKVNAMVQKKTYKVDSIRAFNLKKTFTTVNVSVVGSISTPRNELFSYRCVGYESKTGGEFRHIRNVSKSLQKARSRMF